LTKKLEFSEIAMKGVEFVKERGSVQDVTLMLRLDATPQSWRVWRPALIDLYLIHTFPKSYEDDKEAKIKIEYSKKEKLWRAIDVE